MSLFKCGEVAGTEVVLGDPAGSCKSGWAHAGGSPEAVCGRGESELEEGVSGINVDGHPFAGSGLTPLEEAECSHRGSAGAPDLEQARYGGAAVEVSRRRGDRTDSVRAAPDVREV